MTFTYKGRVYLTAVMDVSCIYVGKKIHTFFPPPLSTPIQLFVGVLHNKNELLSFSLSLSLCLCLIKILGPLPPNPIPPTLNKSTLEFYTSTPPPPPSFFFFLSFLFSAFFLLFQTGILPDFLGTILCNYLRICMYVYY